MPAKNKIKIITKTQAKLGGEGKIKRKAEIGGQLGYRQRIECGIRAWHNNGKPSGISCIFIIFVSFVYPRSGYIYFSNKFATQLRRYLQLTFILLIVYYSNCKRMDEVHFISFTGPNSYILYWSPFSEFKIK